MPRTVEQLLQVEQASTTAAAAATAASIAAARCCYGGGRRLRRDQRIARLAKRGDNRCCHLCWDRSRQQLDERQHDARAVQQ